MGLLDDAIREHLELKRLRASEGPEAAPDQGGALDPLPWGDPIAADGDPAHDRLPPEHPDEAIPETAPTGGDADATEETAELDMHLELGGNPGGADDPAACPDPLGPGPGVVDQDRTDAR
jgi:hypothetical protein